MPWSSRIPTVLAILAALALAALGVWLSGEGRQPSPAQGEAVPAPGDTPPSATTPAALPYPLPQETEPPITPPPTSIPEPTPTPPWNLPTPERPEGTTPTAWPGRRRPADATGGILFVAQDDSAATLGQVPTDAQARPLTESRLTAGLPAEFLSSAARLYPSPDGRHLALVSFYEQYFDPHLIHIVELSGGASWQLGTVFTSPEGIFVEGRFGGWHPDGRHLLLYGGYTGGIFLVDLRGQEPPQYLSEQPVVEAMAISPDGQRLAFTTGPRLETDTHLWVSWADGSNAKRLLSTPGMLEPLVVVGWSPQGDQLLYLRGRELWLTDRDGTTHRSLGASAWLAWSESMPSWSPDGQLIAFPRQVVPISKEETSDGGDRAFRHSTTYLLDVRTGEQRTLMDDDHATGDLYPAWSPDGRWLVFVSNRSGALELWTVQRDGSGLQQLTFTGTTHYAPAWAGEAQEDQP